MAPGPWARIGSRRPHQELCWPYGTARHPPAIIPPVTTLSRTEVEHVAHLARLGLSDAELEELEGQLNHILDQYAILASVPTDHIAPTAQTIELENILREDVVRPSLPASAVLSNAAATEGEFIVVPAILGGG
ncbi:MAG: Asp-tRNA(Asn)/Glu-tRNA(Gln) amidotransferase subunit GatC [Chloroflexi bacterium]|nr:Asp-tRNA(Asn)/Glu-tRNA(Gln) amidotransferase subunit GatC [Chloroflexota bacterium]